MPSVCLVGASDESVAKGGGDAWRVLSRRSGVSVPKATASVPSAAWREEGRKQGPLTELRGGPAALCFSGVGRLRGSPEWGAG